MIVADPNVTAPSTIIAGDLLPMDTVADGPVAKKAKVGNEPVQSSPTTGSEPDHAEILSQVAGKLDGASADKLYASYGHLMQQVTYSDLILYR